MDFDKTKRTTMKQRSDRASHDEKQIMEIIDEALIGHIAFVEDNNTLFQWLSGKMENISIVTVQSKTGLRI